MTEHETYVQALRALKRLRSKSLISGPLCNGSGEVCVAGALGFHLSSRDEIRELEDNPREYAGWVNACGTAMIFTSDDFAHGNNNERAKKARYRHMVRWLEQRIAETAP